MTALTTADVAARRKCNRVTAWRWMMRLQRLLGPHVVRREGPKRLVIDRDVYDRIEREEAAPNFEALASRVGKLELWQQEQDDRIDRLVRRVASVAGSNVRA